MRVECFAYLSPSAVKEFLNLFTTEASEKQNCGYARILRNGNGSETKTHIKVKIRNVHSKNFYFPMKYIRLNISDTQESISGQSPFP